MRYAFVLEKAGERKKIQAQLERLDRLKSLDDSAAAIVHEIRNPLSAISTNAQYMLEKMRGSDPFYEEMRDILADVQSIESTVKTILDFAGNGKQETCEVDIRAVVREVLRLSKMQIRRQGIRVRREIGEEPVRGRADISRLQQVFFNIVRNACHAMGRGGELGVRIWRDGMGEGPAHVVVWDTGPGIPKEHLRSIFEPFYSTKREGIGLGLTISKRIIEEHGGTIDVESQDGKGTRVTVTLP
ncbi:MAG: sensor histidine kinase [Planctomycetota bacterium]